MELKYMLALTIGPSLFVIAVVIFLLICCCRKKTEVEVGVDIEAGEKLKEREGIVVEKEDLIRFNGAEDLTLYDILEAPGEVIGKSSYGTLYKANLQRTNSLALLRFIRPACTLRIKEVIPVIELLGSLRHPNLVPIYAFYSGPKGEKLMVHPFYRLGNLAQFIRDGNRDAHRWAVIYRISIGIAKALNHLHTGMEKPVIHGNLKSNNILLDRQCQPYVSDFGLHLLLNPTAGQQMLEASAMEGYKAPELIKIKDTVEKSDIYSFGVILLEMLTGKEPIDENPTPDQDFHLPNAVRMAILDDKISELYHPEIVLSESVDLRAVIEDRIFRLFQLSMACCSPSPSLRPDARQILTKLQEIGR